MMGIDVVCSLKGKLMKWIEISGRKNFFRLPYGGSQLKAHFLIFLIINYIKVFYKNRHYHVAEHKILHKILIMQNNRIKFSPLNI